MRRLPGRGLHLPLDHWLQLPPQYETGTYSDFWWLSTLIPSRLIALLGLGRTQDIYKSLQPASSAITCTSALV
eukprot:6206897-Pleurochrysis_carterae.AAC.1